MKLSSTQVVTVLLVVHAASTSTYLAFFVIYVQIDRSSESLTHDSCPVPVRNASSGVSSHQQHYNILL